MATPFYKRKDKSDYKTPRCSLLETGICQQKGGDDSGYFTPSPALLSSYQDELSAVSTKKTIKSVEGTPLASNKIPEKIQLSIPRSLERLQNGPVKEEKESGKQASAQVSKCFDRLKPNSSSRNCISHKGHSDRSVIVTTHDIGSWTKATEIDFIQELCKLDLKLIISQILRKLKDSDLVAVCCVSKKWQEMCYNDPSANLRRKNYVKLFRANKQNLQGNGNGTSYISQTRRRPSVLGEVGNVIESGLDDGKSEDQSKLITSKLTVFYETGRTLLPNERLAKCPRCSTAARVNTSQNQAKCISVQCGFYYCIKCYCEVTSSHHCSPLKVNFMKKQRTPTKNAVKRNLKRLLT